MRAVPSQFSVKDYQHIKVKTITCFRRSYRVAHGVLRSCPLPWTSIHGKVVLVPIAKIVTCVLQAHPSTAPVSNNAPLTKKKPESHEMIRRTYSSSSSSKSHCRYSSIAFVCFFWNSALSSLKLCEMLSASYAPIGYPSTILTIFPHTLAGNR